MKQWMACAGFVLTLALSACSEEEVMPAYQQDLVELWTDRVGHPYRMVLDNGKSLSFEPLSQELVHDSCYRAQVLFVENGQCAELYGLSLVFSPLAQSLATYPSHPLIWQAAWVSPRYFNLRVGIKTGGEKHAFAFVHKGLTLHADGRQTLELALAHDQQGDATYYTEDRYLSCPLFPYEQQLVGGRDSVAMEVPTFKGIQRKCFLYGKASLK
ncbi:lipoprotein [gut metagenome]|uniref:Lipoprotein n=1 Tax=gut metagenome TaxID=749906 RepID=J9GJK3_9ZZZZ